MQDLGSGGGITGVLKLALSLTLVLIAGLGVLVVFEVIPQSVLSEGAQKIGLLAVIVGLTGAAVWLVTRIGK